MGWSVFSVTGEINSSQMSAYLLSYLPGCQYTQYPVLMVEWSGIYQTGKVYMLYFFQLLINCLSKGRLLDVDTGQRHYRVSEWHQPNGEPSLANF